MSLVHVNCLTSVSDMHASMLLIVAGRLFAPPLSLSTHDVEDGEVMQVAEGKEEVKIDRLQRHSIFNPKPSSVTSCCMLAHVPLPHLSASKPGRLLESP